MKSQRIVAAGLRGSVLVWLCLEAVCAGGAPAQGPNLIVGDISATTAYVVAGSPKAYALGVVLCNQGPTYANFESVTSAHPVVAANMYRLSNGRFEQIGQSWATHMLTGVAEQSLCNTCISAGDLQKLGAGCSTVSSASTMGTQQSMGPRSEINASTGAVTYPIVNNGTGSGAAFKRLQVAIADMPTGPLYFVSAMCVAADDGAAGNGTDNESYRRVTINFVSSSMSLVLADATQRGAPAIQAWRDNGMGAGMPDPGVMLTSVDVPGDGRFWIASKATDLGGGMWHYEYAVENLNSDRSLGSFGVPVPRNASPNNVDFHGVAYHSGEVYSSSPWTGGFSDGIQAWACDAFDPNPNANALRWGTLYNFRFDVNVPPATREAMLGLFKPGTPSTLSALIVAPSSLCGSADFNCDGDIGTDADIEAFFACVAGNCPAAPCASSADFNADGDVGTDADIEAFFRVLSGGTC
jgi:hypothetical protein